MATTRGTLKQEVIAMLDTLPDDALADVAKFVDYQRHKHGLPERSTPYIPVALGGLWKGIEISDEDIAEARREMWGRFMDPEP